MLSNIFLKSIWDFRKAAIYWAIGISLLALYIIFVLSSIELNAFQTIIDSFPKALTQFIAGESGIDFGSIEGFLNAQIFTIMAPIFAISVAVNSGGKSTANEESTKSLDIILSAPITRESFITQKILSMISKTFFIATVHWISYFLMCKFFSENISAEGLFAICLNLFLMGISFGMISVYIGTLNGNSTNAIAVAGGFALISYLIANIAPLVDSLDFTKYFSLFYYYKSGDPLKFGVHNWHWLPFVAISLIFFTISLVQFRKRNLL